MPPSSVRWPCAGLFVLSALTASAQTPSTQPAAPQGATPVATFTMDVIESAPLPGVGLFAQEIAAPVQTAVAHAIDASGSLDLSNFLNRQMTGVYVNEMQGNPFQPDVSFRGYTASPLLGTPQGLSVYLDGVRQNQPFADIVNWDLIPRVAISSITLMPGSNPLFGLNTLGGALAMQTKDGASSPGTGVKAIYGSRARRSVELEHGGARADGAITYYLAGNVFDEDGWRESSPSEVRQLFGAFGAKRGRSEVKLTLAYADNVLTGNGLQEQRFLDRDRASVYSKPDETANRGGSLVVNGQHRAGRWTLSGVAYVRRLRTRTFNGDVNEEALGQLLYQPGEHPANTPFPFARCLANATERDEPAEACNGLLNRTQTLQRHHGLSGQATRIGALRGRRNQFTVGGGLDHSHADFRQSTELGYLRADRSVAGVGAFGDGVTGGTIDGEPYDTRVDLGGTVQTASLYVTDTLAPGDAWRVTVSGRYDRTRVRNRDRILPGGGPGSLDGDHTFGRFNPAVGITFSPATAVNLYAGYSEGSRAPTAIELGCADPDRPCKLPNAMAGDPPLKQVVTRTWEAGVRNGDDRNQAGGARPATRDWRISFFHAENDHDLLFVASEQSGYGYFTNVGATRRQGIELGLNQQVGARLTVGAGYTWLDATYRSAETVDGSSNSTNDSAEAGAPGLEGTIDIEPGDRLALVPRHMLKAFASIQATRAISLRFGLIGASSAFARGNENNRHTPDGVSYLGSGASDGYAIADLGATWQITPRIQLLAQIDNLFDRRYATAAQLGPTAFSDAGTFSARPLPPIDGEYPVRRATFYAPGAPRLFWAGTRLTF